MKGDYDHLEVEQRISKMWETGNYFSPKIVPSKKTFSMFLPPPNASGPMHIGNILMIAIQDIQARHYRGRNYTVVWIPGTDHGGYETQVTFDRETGISEMNQTQYNRMELFDQINKFVQKNNDLIKSQIKKWGASVDWSRFRFTMDSDSLDSVNSTFKKMVSDKLIYRANYMVNYCPSCGTVLADIELKERKSVTPLYFVKFFQKDENGYVSIATFRPEFIFATTHILVHPDDKMYSNYIGKILKNPVNGEDVHVVASKRKFDSENNHSFLFVFAPSYIKYDYEYTLRNSIPSKNLLDWNGNLVERYPGIKPLEAREEEIKFLEEKGLIEKIDTLHEDSDYLCKKGHAVESKIMLTWFLKIDDNVIPLRKNAVNAIRNERLEVFPRWREKGLIEWMDKMHDWPIARQNVWGIKIPVWYEVTDTSKFTVWFVDKNRERRFGNLKDFLDSGTSFEEVLGGLERVYAEQDVVWTMNKKEGVMYLPETDTFDTWFSSGQWGTIVYEKSKDFSYFYPSHSVVTGYDLLRLFISRMILLGTYTTKRLPFKKVYLHRLILGSDGQKMSKSLGNAVDPETYLENYGADVTRMALVSYTNLSDDFIFSNQQLELFKNFSISLWNLSLKIFELNLNSKNLPQQDIYSKEDKKIILDLEGLCREVEFLVDKFSFALAQEKACQFLSDIEFYSESRQIFSGSGGSVRALNDLFSRYLKVLNPFMPFMTEEININLYGQCISPFDSTSSDKE